MAKKPMEIKKRGKLTKGLRKKIRVSKREDVPSSYFLKAKEKKYPYKDFSTGQIRGDLLEAARKRATMQGDIAVQRKADNLLKKHKLLKKDKKK